MQSLRYPTESFLLKNQYFWHRTQQETFFLECVLNVKTMGTGAGEQ